MRQSWSALAIGAVALIQVSSGFGQDVISDALRMGYTDMAETKRRAEGGDARAQVALANTLAGQFRPADALTWYQKAAQQGSIEAIYRVGTTLLRGARGIPAEKTVKADPVTGIELIFCAATNRYKPAYHDMFTAYRDGIGVAKDGVQAYAWLQFDVDATAGPLTSSVKRAELNRLALDMDVATSQAGKRLAAQFKAGHWPKLVVVPPAPAVAVAAAPAAPKPVAPPAPATKTAPAVRPDPGLKLTGLLFGSNPVAVISGKAVAEGETVTVGLKPKPVTFKCIKIESNSVVVVVEGEDEPRRVWKGTNAVAEKVAGKPEK
jgi:hypothetical protein